MARGLRQGCLASGFLFSMAFDPIFRSHSYHKCGKWLTPPRKQEYMALAHIYLLDSSSSSQKTGNNLYFFWRSPVLQLSQGTSTIWSSCSLHNVLTLRISLLYHHVFESWCLFWHMHSVLSTALLDSTWFFVHAAGFSMETMSMILGGPWSRKILKKSVNCRLFDTPNILELWLSQMDTFIVGRHTFKSSFNAWWKSIFYQRSVWGTFLRCTRFPCWVFPSTKPLSMPRTMPFAVPQQDRTTLFLFSISGRLHVWTWPCFGWHSSYQSSGSTSGCSMLIHSPQRSRKSQWGTRAQLHSSLCSLSHLGTGVSFPSMTYHTANAFYIFADWTVTSHLTKLFKT